MSINSRPLNIVTIESATFDDVAKMDFELLAKRDATLIERIHIPGYERFLQRIAMRVAGCPVSKDLEIEREVQNDPFSHVLRARVQQIFGPERFHTEEVKADVGIHETVRMTLNESPGPHIDNAPLGNNGWGERIPSVTAFLTYYIASRTPWALGLNRNAGLPTTELKRQRPEFTIPLTVGSLLLLGENARIDSSGIPCTPIHEVIAPEESWHTEVIQRVRSMHISKGVY